MRIPYLSLGVLLTMFCLPSFAQSSEYIKNPSFEDVPRQARAPRGWFDCGFPDESAVDVHGEGPDFESEFFGVREYADHGKTFLGMVVRDNGTYEGVSARLRQPLLSGTAYKLTVSVNQAISYHSSSRLNDTLVNYDEPILFEIWGGDKFCDMNIFIAEHDVNQFGVWRELTFHLTPEEDINFLSLFARQAFEEDVNGNVLVDNLQLVKVDAVTLKER